MPRDDEWGEDWIREDDDWQDPRVDDPTRVDDGWDELADVIAAATRAGPWAGQR